MSYRAADEWNSKFDRSRLPAEKLTGKRFEREFEIENYLEYNAQKFINSFDPNSYLYLSRAMDWFDIAEHGDSISDGMSKLKVNKALVVGVTTDILFPARQQQEIADVMRDTGTNVDYVEIDFGEWSRCLPDRRRAFLPSRQKIPRRIRHLNQFKRYLGCMLAKDAPNRHKCRLVHPGIARELGIHASATLCEQHPR